MKTKTKTVQKHGFVVAVNETSGRYDFYDPEPTYALNDKIYDTEAKARRALKSYVLKQYGPEYVDDFNDSCWSYENGAERDEENYEIELKVVEIDHYEIETTKTIRV